jgi:hypothetical protein
MGMESFLEVQVFSSSLFVHVNLYPIKTYNYSPARIKKYTESKFRRCGVAAFFFLFLVLPLSLHAQTADEMETLLNAPRINYAQAARFVLEASETAVLQEPEEAFRYAMERNWLPKNAGPGEEASLGGISLLLMRSFSLRGGIFYSLFMNPHYAYHERIYTKAIFGRTDPDQSVSGELFLHILGRVLYLTEPN